MFFALYVNRNNLDDPKQKQKYIENVEETKEQMHTLFDSLQKKQPTPPDCSPGSLKKRSPISGLADLAGDIPKLASCATVVVNALEEDVKAPEPPVSEVEDLTDTLNEIGKHMDENGAEEQTSTSSSSTATCTFSTAVPQCTETVSLSTSFYSGTASSSTVSTFTSTACSTVTTC